MIATALYNEDVRRYFADPRHAGDLQEDYELTLVADVSESDSGAHVEMSAGIRGGIIIAMAYRVWGCPHLVAALELVCETLEGQPVSGLENFESADINRPYTIAGRRAGDALGTLRQHC
jgi:NifU-like protein involved in Fe-S cluster formation